MEEWIRPVSPVGEAERRRAVEDRIKTLKSQRRARGRARRSTPAWVALKVVLALLAVVSGFFRLDHATRGRYRGRLQWIAAGAILGLIAAGVLLGRRIPWV